MKRILIGCGGGMKGLPAAMALDALTTIARGKLPYKVDLMAGTSVGGINLLLASVAQSATRFFTEDGPKIFKPSIFRQWPQYRRATIEECLRARFRGFTLADCRTKILVTAFDKQAQIPFLFKSYSADNLPARRKTPLWQIARATSAAQKFFPAYAFGTRLLQDGGNVANNPAVCALADAVFLWGDQEPVKVLVLGCGQPAVSVPRWPIWLQELILTILAQFDTGAEEVDYQMRQFIGDSYRVIQPRFAKAIALDSADPQSLAYLHEAGVRMIDTHQTDLEWFLK